MTHEYAESLGWIRNKHPELITESCKTKYIADKKWLIPTTNKECAVLDFYDNLDKNLHFVFAEAKVYSNKSEVSMVNTQFCGTFDLLFWYDNPKGEKGLVLMDWKTNKELTNSFSRSKGNKLLHPFDDFYEEPLSYYSLQLSLYSLCLRGIGLNVLGCRVIWLKDDGKYEIIKVPDFSLNANFKEYF